MYKDLAAIPVPTSVQFLNKCPNVVQLVFSVRDFIRNTKRQMSKSLAFSTSGDDDLVSSQVCMATNLQDNPEMVLEAISPSERKRAILRKNGNRNGDSSGNRYVEVWKDGLLEVSLDVTDLHGDFYSDEFLGSLEFAPSESALVYVAEVKNAKDPYQKFRFNPDFGEGLVGKRDPAIFLLRWSPPNPPSLSRLKPAGIDRVRFGQPVFDPQNCDFLYATGYEPTKDGRILGIKGCYNRPSGIWRMKITQSSPSESVAQRESNDNFQVSDAATMAQKLTPPHLSCRSPRVFNDGQRSTLIWLACACGGAHMSTSRLHKLDITSVSDQLDQNSLIASDIPLVDIVPEPLKDLSSFPGLYPSYNLALSPFIFLGADSEPGILVHSQWGSRTVILRVSIKDGSIRNVTPDVDGLYSWSLLATDQRRDFVCFRSSAKVPYEILLGRFQKNGDVDWLLLDKPSLQKKIADALGSIKTTIIPVDGKQLVETIVIESEKNEGIPPCVMVPHGGPHAASTTAFASGTTALVLAGYTVSLPNYTGSPGYGETFLQGLIGRCGELDVADCIASARHLINLGISEDGPGKQLITGGSHGGFLTAHLIGKFPSFFSAAVLRNPVISVGELSSTDIPDWYFSEFGLHYPLLSSSRPFDPPREQQPNPPPPLITTEIFEKLRSASPILNIGQIRIPVLLLIGKADRRVAPSHGIEFYHALSARYAARDEGKNVEMLWFDGESHPLDGVEVAKVSFEAAEGWFAKARLLVTT